MKLLRPIRNFVSSCNMLKRVIFSTTLFRKTGSGTRKLSIFSCRWYVDLNSYMLALQLIDRVEAIHSLGYVHRDLKPENLLMGLGELSPFLFLIDFGKVNKYRSKGVHYSYIENIDHSMLDPCFCSINVHNGLKFSRRDDIESIMYLIVYLIHGKLPWANIQVVTSLSRN